MPAQIGPLLNTALAAVVCRVRYLLDQLEPDGQPGPLWFRDYAVTTLTEFLTGVLLLPELKRRPDLARCLHGLAEQLAGVQPEELRTFPVLRECVAAELRHVLNQLHPLVDSARKEPVHAAT